MVAVDQTARRRRIKQKPDPEPAARSLPPFSSSATGPLAKQTARLYSGKPTSTVESLRDKTKVECLVEFIQALLSASDPQDKLTLLTEAVENAFQLASSKKNMIGSDLGRLEPPPSLKSKAKACASV